MSPNGKWELINNPSEIPNEVIRKVVEKTRNKSVIDFGSGVHVTQHINFEAAYITRWDARGIITCNQPRSSANLEELVLINDDHKFVFCFFRVLSILSSEEFSELTSLLSSVRDRIECIIVYDYTFNERRAAEYVQIKGPHDMRAGVFVEWWNTPFYHYTISQLQNKIGGRITFHQEYSIPAVKKKDDFGTLLFFEY